MTESTPTPARPAPGAGPAPAAASSGGRLESIDALRGFNMFWIMGGAELFASTAAWLNIPWLLVVSDNLTEHVEWEGFHFHDMIFPLFLFIMGVTTPFSVGRRREKGAALGELVRHTLIRTAILFFLGWVYSGLFKLEGWNELRIMGVLQRLALGSGVAVLCYLFFALRVRIGICIALLLAYWAAMKLCPVPGHPVGSMDEHGNFANYVDRLIFKPGQLYKEYGDPEGLFSTIPAISTALLGIFAGEWLRSSRAAMEKVKGLVIAGALGIALGYAWSPLFPVIKKIWTSSYVLVAGGWSALLLACFYWIIDVRGARRWAYFFVVIGLNPITIYLGQRMIDFDKTAEFFVAAAAKMAGHDIEVVILALAGVAVRWLFLHFLHRQKIYLKV